MIFLHLNLAIKGQKIGDYLIMNCKVCSKCFILKADKEFSLV